MRLLRSDANAVMNDDTLDQTTPVVTLDNRVIDFAAVQNEELKTTIMVLRNVGPVPLQWHFVNSEEIRSSIPWLHFSPFNGALDVKQEIKISVTVDGRLLHAELMRLTEGTIADVVNFEDVVILRVRGGAEFCCNVSGHMNLHMHRHTRDDPEESYNCTDTCITSIASTTAPKPRVDVESRVQMRPTEGIFSFMKPAGNRTVFSRLFMILSRWSESSPSSSINMKDAIAAANIAGFV